MKTIPRFIEKISDYGIKPAIIEKGVIYTYSQLHARIQFYNEKLKNLKIREGDIVFLLSDYSVEAIALFFSLSLNKNLIIPVTTDNTEEIKDRLNEAKPNWILDLNKDEFVFVEENRSSERHSIINSLIKENASGLVLFSSGTTGKPKAMVHNLDKLLEVYLDRKSKEMNFLVFLMFDHIGGLNTLFNCLSMGVVITIPPNRNPDDISKLIEKFKINILPASPTFLNLMVISGVFEKYDFSSLKMVTYGTEAMPEGLLLRLKEKLPRVKFLQTFGTSETGIVKAVSKSSSSTFLKFDDPDQEFQIVKGELWLRSKTQILGYINHHNESFTDDGWFKTGDLVEESDDGYLRIIGRTKEMINVGGEKVLPGEVESVIMEIDSILDCIVRGEKNAITGQMVCADIVLKEGFDFKEEKSKVKKYCMQRLEMYKVPLRINLIDSIAVTSRFKKDRLL